MDVVTGFGNLRNQPFNPQTAYGNHVRVRHADGRITIYAHLGLIQVIKGTTVTSGIVLGQSDNSGWSTAPHLHFEVRDSAGRKIDPYGSRPDRTACDGAFSPMCGTNPLWATCPPQPWQPVGVWAPISTSNAPSLRYLHTAVWTGTEMIVWGGGAGDGSYPNTGGRYNPSADAWTTTTVSGAPAGRALHTSIWSGDEMIVWGGTGTAYFNTGGRYNPATDVWTTTTVSGAPIAREFHTAIWSGFEMIIWGGVLFEEGYTNSGGRYSPAADSWTLTATMSAPSARYNPTAVWIGSDMIVWGGDTNSGFTNTGGIYSPAANAWGAMAASGAPTARFSNRTIWTGSLMVLWGGNAGTPSFNTGGQYNPATNSWSPTSTIGAPAARSGHTAIWSGSEMIVWGGLTNVFPNTINTGGMYNPISNVWITTPTSGAPTPRFDLTAVWTGEAMIVWGGTTDTGYLNTGGRYTP